MAEQQVKFKKVTPNFKTILEKQKQMEDDEKFAISDSLQSYIDDIQKNSGYQNQDKLEKAGIRQEIINFVDNYTIADLDSIKGMDYDEALQLQKSTDKKIDETIKTGQLEPEEIEYIKATVGETNKRLGEVLGVSTRLKFAFRDLKKELKPLKLAARVGLTRIPIIGKRIERAIRAEEEGESEALRIKRGLRKREARDTRKMGDTAPIAPNDQSQTQQNKTIAKQTTAGIMGIDNQPVPRADREEIVEQERESDTQFETTSGTLEKILAETELTNELLGARNKRLSEATEDDGFSILEVLGMKKLYDFVKAGRVGTLVKNLGAMSVTAGLFAAAAVAGIGLGKVIEKVGTANVGPKELEEIKDISTDLTSSANNEGVLAEDIALEDARKKEGQLEDEYDRGIAEGKLPAQMTFEDYKQAKEDAGITRRLRFEGYGGLFFADSNRKKSDADFKSISSQYSQNQAKPINEAIIQAEGEYGTGQKIENANTITADGVEKGSTIINNSQNSGNTVINNQNNVDASNTENKTEFGSSSIGSKNTHYPDNY
tara:strand:- start:549 stop:2183 length:1635 start_codon:yes stop_codon:yes gene_type:complete